MLIIEIEVASFCRVFIKNYQHLYFKTVWRYRLFYLKSIRLIKLLLSLNVKNENELSGHTAITSEVIISGVRTQCCTELSTVCPVCFRQKKVPKIIAYVGHGEKKQTEIGSSDISGRN